jgi:photosystem II stability/assembly factor-like uncharacterized protein
MREYFMKTLSCRVPRWLVLSLLLAGLGLLLPPISSEGQGPAKAKQAEKGPGKASEATPSQPALPEEWVKAMHWRCVGPANMGGRITAISVYEADPSTYYIATASGGLLKTINNGTTFEHQFDKEATVSIGAVCVALSDPKIVWVGSGEHLPRNSVSYGDGVYKSVDGGKSWKNMGLKESFQIGRIAIHPKNPDIVYVGALGRLYGPNSERGVYKTTDGGTTWEKILYLDDKTGIIDIKMHPSDPDTLLIAAWERMRDGFDSYIGKDIPDGLDTYDPIKRWGPKSGIYKTTNGGKTFDKVSKGLPTNQLGRICLDYYRKDPNIVYAIVDCEKIGMGTPPKKKPAGDGGKAVPYLGVIGEDVEKGAKLVTVTDEGPAQKAGLQAGDIIQEVDKKAVKSYGDLLDIVREHKPGDNLMLKVLRDEKVKDIKLTLGERTGGRFGGGGFGGPGGAKKNRPWHAYYGGQKENIQDEQGPNSHEYGGIYKSTDGGDSWTRINSLNPRPMYFSELRVDPSDNQYLYVLGVALYRSKDGGKTFRPDGSKSVHADQHALWIDPKDGRHILVGTDGGTYVTYDRMEHWDHLNHLALGQFYHVAVCNKQPYYVYGGLQDNGSWGGPSVGLRGMGSINEDWISVGSGDGFVCRVDSSDPDLVYSESQNGNMSRRNLRTGERGAIRPARKKGEPQHRFNWNTPFILSNHNPKIFYCAGEYVFRSLNRGDNLRIISPEITLTKRGSATALAESPKNAEVLWVGTDDGALWVTRNGGKDWNNVTAKVGLPGPFWVSTIEASRFVEGRAYVCFDAHRSDNDEPWVYVTEDFGQTWKSIRGKLPTGSSRCLREDIENPNLLYCGTEFALFVSLDRGGAWTKLNNNLPTVAIHEVAIHPTAGEIVAATHGRSLWILDVTALRQMSPSLVKKQVHLYKPNAVVRRQPEPARGGTNRRFVGENPKPGAMFYYSLGQKANKVTLKVLDIDGKVVAQRDGATRSGLHVLNWDFTPGKGRKGKGGGGGGKGGGGGGGFGGLIDGQLPRPVPAGVYRVVLDVDGQEQSQRFRIEGEAVMPGFRFGGDEDD